MTTFLLISVFGLLLIAGLSYWLRRRFKYLMDKYQDEEIVRLIMRGEIWLGMSHEQLLDSWGTPLDIDKAVFKTKTRLTLK
jgi:hypothetical protein